MRSNFIYSLMIVLPLTAYTACGSDDDTTQGSAGSSGSHVGGGAGNGASEAGADSAGAGGFDASGGSLGGGAGGGFGNGGAAGAGFETAGSGNEAGSGGDSGAGGAAAMLTDAQVLKILADANQGEVSAGQVAVPAAQSTAVANFAQMMITMHSAANAQTLGLVSTKHIAPGPSDVSQGLEDETAALLVALSATASANFDKVYITSQVTMHTEVLHLIDTRLVPSAADPDLKALLTAQRATVMSHLQQAQALLATL